MNTLRNSVQLIGRTGNKPEIKSLDNGNKRATVGIATNEVYYNQAGEKQEITTWHNLVAWGKVAEIFEKHIEKGKEIAIQGKLSYRTYDDKDGQKKSITEIIVNEVLLF